MSKKKSCHRNNGLVFEELEPRLLLSADPLAVATDAGESSVHELVVNNNEDQVAIVQTQVEQSVSPARNELVIIDSRAPNFQQLHNDLIEAKQQGRNVHVVILDAHRDGIEQINEALSSHNKLDAVHIVSHGDDAQVQLGASQLNKTTLRDRSADIAQWRQAFSEDGDLLIYGCDLASTSEGRSMVHALGYLTAADVAASDDLTGNSLNGGDWELEYEAGDIETDVAFSEQVQDNWQGTLEGSAPAAQEEQAAEEQQQEQQAQAELLEQQTTRTQEDQETTSEDEQQQQVAITQQQRQEVVFIDESVTDFQAFIDDLQNNSNGSTTFEIVLLNGDSSGIEQINDVLADYNEVDALHILSHGDDGSVKLGNTWLNVSNIDQHGDTLSAWGDALDQDGDILIYGCSLAESVIGEQFVSELAQLTGADVAASDDITGHTSLGGDWELEYKSGSIETSVALDTTTQSEYQGVLNTFIVSNTNATGAGSLHQAILDANANAGVTDTITFSIAGAGPHVINLTSALPTITDTVIIDGSTEPDYAGDPVVRIDGTSAGGGVNGLTFAATSDQSVVRGLMITNFSGYGIQVNAGADRIRIVNNWIGTTGTGSTGDGNSNTGINIQGANTIVGGSGTNDGNVITNNGNEGINITGAGATGTIIQGNIIGLDPDGSTGSGNTDVGIALLAGAHNTIIGGTVAAERNVISNNFEGIEINSNNNVVQGNYIGTDASGLLDRGNRFDDGVEIQSNATGNLIGGTDPGAGNLIAFNARDGVYIVNGTGNSVLGNSIHSNTGLGIDLGANGVNTNDVNDVDTGANDLQNHPLLSSVLTNGTNTIAIAGSLNSTATTDFRIEFFASTVADASGNGEAERYLGSVNLSTDAGGNATFSANLTELVANGEFITATATVDNGGGSYGSTSEFAQSVSTTLTSFAPTLHAWYNDAWDYRKDIIIDSSRVDANLTDFPVLINLNADADLAAFAQADGDDILFTSADGTKLAHEIESYNSATGALTVWVKTDLSATMDTRLFLYYGNATAASQQDAANVWDSSYMGVWHLNDTPTGVAGDINDSTANNNDGTTEGAMDAADSVAAKIGTGLDFDEVDDLIRMQDSATLDSVADEATLELWIWFDAAADGDHQFIMSSSNRFSATDGFEWASQGSGNHFFYPDAMTPDGNYNLGPNPFMDQQWHHLAATLDFATKDADVYVDGVAVDFSTEGVPTNWSTLTSSDDWLWGGNPDRASRYFDGMMDEIRVSDVVRSQQWIQTSINNQSDPSTFFTLGAAESRDLILTAVNEDDTNPPGDTVLAILNSGAGDRITDVDAGALEGIAVVGVDDSNGQWQYDATGGGTWVAFGAVSDASAVLLDIGASIRFVPNADYYGTTGDLTFRAWDLTSGANGDSGINVTVNGGTTAFSTATTTMSSSVNSINDAAPVANNDNYTVNQDQTLNVNALTDNATAADLSAAWQFEEGSGTSTTDVTGNANDGTLIGGTAWTTSSRTGEAALVFDGVDDYVQTTGSSLDLSTATSFTLSSWFKTDTTTGEQHILWQGVSTENGWGTPATDSPLSSEMHLTVGRHNLDDKITFFMGYHDANPASIDITSASNFTDTSGWHQAVVVVTDLGGGTLQADLYVDGVLEGSDTGTQIDRSQWDSDLRIGRGGQANRFFDGTIDEIGIYNRALTATEVTDLYQTGVISNDTDIDGDILSASLVAGPANGVLALNSDGSFTYTPNPGFVGSDSFSYKVNDGFADSNTATVTIDVVNTAPVATDDPGGFNSTITSYSPSGYWRLGETSGTSAADDGTSGINGTYNGVTLGQAGAINGDSNTAVSFDGVDDYVEILHDPAYLLDDGTVQLWFNTADVNQRADLFSKDALGNGTGGHLSVYLDGLGNIETRLQSNTASYLVTSTLPLTNNQWHHVAFTFGAGGMQLYVDGQLQDSDAYTGGMGITSGDVGNFEPIAIGASTQVSAGGAVAPLQDYYTGSIDEVALIATPLSAEQVQDLYASALQNYTIVEDASLVVAVTEGVLINDSDPDGDPLTASLVAGPSNAAAFSLNPDGSFSYTPLANFSGTDTFTYMANDGSSDSNVATVTITVTDVNDAPAARDDRIGLVFDGVDDYVTIGDYAGLNVTTNVTMEAWVKPTGLGTGSKIIVNKEGEYEMAITADTGEVKWAFDNVDPNWVWHNTGYFVQAGEWTHLAVTYNNGVVNTYANGVLVDTYNGSGAIADNYPVMNELQIGGRENAVNQRFDGQIDEVRIWNTTRSQLDIQNNMNTLLTGAEAGLIGNWRFDEGSGITVEDQSVFGHHGTLADGITAGEMPAWQGYVVSEDGTLTVTAVNGVLPNDYDIDGDPLTAVLDTGPANAAAFTLNPDGSFTYTPTANFNGIDSFTYHANDGTVDSNIATVTIRVYPVNDAPQASNLNAAETYTEDTALNLTDIVVSDVDSANVTVTLTLSDVTAGSLNTGTSGAVTSTFVGGVWTASGAIADVNTLLAGLTFTPSFNYNSNFNIATSVDDGVAPAITGTKVMTGTPVNDVPVANANTVTTTEDNAYNFTAADFTFSDVEGDSLVSARITNLLLGGGTLTYGGGTAVISGNTLTAAQLNTLVYTPPASANGSPLATFDFTVNDADIGVVTAQMSINVTVVNNAPTATNLNAAETYTEDTALNLTDIVVSDVDSPNVTVTLTLSDITAGSLNTATSGGVTSTFAGGVWTASGAIADVNTLLAGLTFTPSLNYNSNFNIATSVSDGVAPAITGTKVMTGIAVNDSAVIAGVDTGTVTEDDDPDFNNFLEVSGSLTIIDPDAGEAAFNPAVLGGTYGVITLNAAGDWDYAANTNQVAIQGLAAGATLLDTITVSSVDGTTHDINITIMGTNDAPVAGNDVANVNEAGSVIIDVAATDSDIDDALDLNSIMITGLPANGTVVVNGDGTVTYTHDGSETLLDSFTYTISDISGAVSNSATVTVNINPVNDPPVAGNDTATVTEGNAVLIDLAANDSDVDNALDLNSITIIGAPANGALVVNGDGTVTYTHDGSNTVSDSLTYTISDISGAISNTATVNITITAVNNAPTTTGIAGVTVSEDAPNTNIDLNAAFDDSDNLDSELTYSIVGNNNIGLFTATGIDGATGRLTLDYAADMNGSAQISVRATDPAGLSVDTLFTVTVTPVNDSPVVQANTGMLASRTAQNVLTSSELNVTDIDNTSAEITYTVTALPANGALLLNGTVMAVNDTFTQADLDNNLLAYQPAGTTSADQFGFTVADSSGAALTNNTFDILVQVAANNDDGDTDNGVPPDNGDTDEEPEPEDSSEAGDGGLPVDAGEYGGGYVPIGSTSAPQVPPPALSIDPVPEKPSREQVIDKEERVAEVEQHNVETFAAVQVKSMDALWGAIDKMKQEMGGSTGDKVSPAEFKVAAAKSSGVVLTAGVVAWILRSGALLSSLMSTIPLWKGYDPLPILAYKDDEEKKEEDEIHEDKIPTSLEELQKLKKLKEKKSREVDVDSIFGGSAIRE